MSGVDSVHRYSFRAIGPEYARAAIGILCVAIPLAIVPAPPIVHAVLAVLAVLFVAYGISAALRQTTRITLTDTGIESSGWRHRRILWSEMTRLSLAFYSTRRAAPGWMQLRLKGPDGGLKIESTLDAFLAVVRRAARAAFNNRLTLDQATLANLHALGVDTGSGDRDG